MRWRWRAAWLAALLAAAVIGFGGQTQSLADRSKMAVPPLAAASGTSAATLAKPAEAAVGGVKAAAAQAGALGSRDDAARALLMQRMVADWCGFGAAENERQSEAVMQRAQDKHGSVGAEAIEEMQTTPGAQVLKEAAAQVRQRWVKALMQRGDPRSAAVAELLGGADGDALEARARLQALARTSSDPMVTALALQRPCDVGACANIETSQWSRLEPANLQAWLTLLRDPKGGARQTLVGYVLERAASEARYSRTYEREFKTMLLSLPQTEAPGLANEAEMQLVLGTAAAWSIAGIRPLMEACRSGMRDAASAHHCVTVADVMWDQDGLLDRMMALSLARRLVAAMPEQKLRWEPRATQNEAVWYWLGAAAERAEKSPPPGHSPCDAQAEQRTAMRAEMALGEWGHARAQMREGKADDAALSADWRRGRGRGMLDPEATPAR